MNDAAFYVIDRFLGVIVEAENFILYELRYRCVFGFHLGLPYSIDLLSLQTSEGGARRNVLSVAFWDNLPGDGSFYWMKLYCFGG